MPKSTFEIADDTKNVLFRPTPNLVYADDKNAPPLKRRTPKSSKAKPIRAKTEEKTAI